MPYDPAGTGAGPDDLLVRRGVSWESAARLERQALKAEQAGLAENGLPFGYGVSVTSPEANQRLARDPKDAVTEEHLRRLVSKFAIRPRNPIWTTIRSSWPNP